MLGILMQSGDPNGVRSSDWLAIILSFPFIIFDQINQRHRSHYET